MYGIGIDALCCIDVLLFLILHVCIFSVQLPQFQRTQKYELGHNLFLQNRWKDVIPYIEDFLESTVLCLLYCSLGRVVGGISSSSFSSLHLLPPLFLVSILFLLFLPHLSSSFCASATTSEQFKVYGAYKLGICYWMTKTKVNEIAHLVRLSLPYNFLQSMFAHIHLYVHTDIALTCFCCTVREAQAVGASYYGIWVLRPAKIERISWAAIIQSVRRRNLIRLVRLMFHWHLE